MIVHHQFVLVVTNMWDLVVTRLVVTFLVLALCSGSPRATATGRTPMEESDIGNHAADPLSPLLQELCEPCKTPESCSIGRVIGLADSNETRNFSAAFQGRSGEPTLLFPAGLLAPVAQNHGVLDHDSMNPDMPRTVSLQNYSAVRALQWAMQLLANDSQVLDLLGNSTVQWSGQSSRIVKNRGEGELKATFWKVVTGQMTASRGNGSMARALSMASPWYIFDRDFFFNDFDPQPSKADTVSQTSVDVNSDAESASHLKDLLSNALNLAFFRQPLLDALPVHTAARGVGVSGFTFDGDAAATPARYLFVGPNSSGVGFHAHAESSALLLRGKKLWFLYSEDQVQRMPDLLAHQSHPRGTAYWAEEILPLLQPEHRPRCFMQHPGTMLHLPEGWHHATLNLAQSSGPGPAASDLVIAIGNQRKLASPESLLLYLSAAQQLMSQGLSDNTASGGGMRPKSKAADSLADTLELLRAAMRRHPSAAAPLISMGNALLQASMTNEAKYFFITALDKRRAWRREEAWKGLCQVGLRDAVLAGFDAMGAIDSSGKQSASQTITEAVHNSLQLVAPYCRAAIEFDPWAVDARTLWAEFTGLVEAWSPPNVSLGLNLETNKIVQLPQPPSFLGSPAENQFQSIRSDDPANIEVLQKHANFAVSLATFGAPRSAGSEVQAFVAKRENAAKSALLLQELVRREPTQAPFAAAMFASLSTELFTSPYADMHAIQEGLGFLSVAAALHPARFEGMRQQVLQSLAQAT
eukprot:INCI19261.1.p1 GENE.INCI19261.1~~INCI19261.1.p1  ORF type:complete len:754 (+),score=124.54 INCI19261.1:202-2463(+)